MCSVAWSPNGSRLAVGGIGRAGFCKILDVTNGREILDLAEARCPVAWSPDGKRLASGGVGHLGLQDVGRRNGKMLLSVDAGALGQCSRFHGVRTVRDWSPLRCPTGRRIWDTATGREIRCLGHGDNLSDAVWSPDGKRIATASGESGLRCGTLPAANRSRPYRDIAMPQLRSLGAPITNALLPAAGTARSRFGTPA